MKILFTTEALTIGGIEVLALRFSEAFGAAGHEVILYDFEPAHRVEGLVQKFDQTKFRIVSADRGPALNWLIWKANSLLSKTGIHSSFRRRLIEKHFAEYLATQKFDVICSLTFHVDYLVCKYAPGLGIPVVVSMHGIYEAVSPQHPEMAKFIYERVSAIIYAAEKNMSYYRVQPYFKASLPTAKIYTGTDLETSVPATVTRSELGIAADAFLYILVARGIKEKGWQEAIEAFNTVKAHYPHAALLLVGEGDFLRQLQVQYQDKPGIVFHGFHPSSIELTRLADVGILPTYFAAETMPNVIIDYLRCGLPVIASAIGEIPSMLQDDDNQTAGILLPLSLPDTGVDINDLTVAMESYFVEPTLYEEQAAIVRRVRKKFDINNTLNNYLSFFKQILTLYK